MSTVVSEAERKKLKRQRRQARLTEVEKAAKKKTEDEVKVIWDQLLDDPTVLRYINGKEMKLCAEECGNGPVTGQHKCLTCGGYTHGFCARLLEDTGFIKCKNCRNAAEDAQVYLPPPAASVPPSSSSIPSVAPKKTPVGKKPVQSPRLPAGSALGCMARHNTNLAASSSSMPGVTDVPVSNIQRVINNILEVRRSKKPVTRNMKYLFDNTLTPLPLRRPSLPSQSFQPIPTSTHTSAKTGGNEKAKVAKKKRTPKFTQEVSRIQRIVVC